MNEAAMNGMRLLVSGVAAVALLMAGGCTTSQSPAARQADSLTVTVPEEGDVSTRPAPTPGGYPDFSRPLTAANTQMSNEDAASLQQRMTALGAARRAGTVSEAEYQRRLAELRKLALEHGTDAQAQIAN
ncbi:SHOCT domain-containing protein [Agrobacterium sp. a22-2]|uniref:SHOCT domain-containing protein n=1 Tax=Agrobacterium sp. a22-2 TaxID=2283840 RepID=UPI0014475A04|nr:SHOCT domain-containing protein [Agrobacterium sp. a22-2]